MASFAIFHMKHGKLIFYLSIDSGRVKHFSGTVEGVFVDNCQTKSACYYTNKLDCTYIISHSKFRYNENEILTKVEELRGILCEKEGMTTKDKKEGKARYVTFNMG